MLSRLSDPFRPSSQAATPTLAQRPRMPQRHQPTKPNNNRKHTHQPSSGSLNSVSTLSSTSDSLPPPTPPKDTPAQKSKPSLEKPQPPLPRPSSPPPADDPSKPFPAALSSSPLNSRVQHQRPSTAGTEAALRLSRHHAAEALRKARRAERAYTSRKRAKLARANKVKAAEHFRQARGHARLAVGLGWEWVKGWRYLVLEGWEDVKQKREVGVMEKGVGGKKMGEEVDEKKTRRWGRKADETKEEGGKKKRWTRKGKGEKGKAVEETVREVDGSGSDESEDESVVRERRRERKWGKRREEEAAQEVDESRRSESEDEEQHMSDDKSDREQRRSRGKSRRSRDEKV